MISFARLAVPAIAGFAMFAPAISQAATAEVTATYESQGKNAYYYKSTDLSYLDGTLVTTDPVYVFCIDGPLHHYSPGTLQTFTATDSYVFKSGESDWGFAAMSYALDNYYPQFIRDTVYSPETWEDNRGFQEAIWDLSYDFTGTVESLDDLRNDPYDSYLTIIAGIQAAISNGILTSSYRSSVYNVFILDDASDDYQDWLAFTTSDVDLPTVAPVPLPAGALLLLSGIGAFAAVRRKKRT